MTYEEAKRVVENFFNGISQQALIVSEAMNIVSERDFYDIQMNTQR